MQLRPDRIKLAVTVFEMNTFQTRPTLISVSLWQVYKWQHTLLILAWYTPRLIDTFPSSMTTPLLGFCIITSGGLIPRSHGMELKQQSAVLLTVAWLRSLGNITGEWLAM